MADVELVIKLNEEIYTHILSRYKYQDINDIGLDEIGKVGVTIKNGTPLPKEHGKLKDADKIKASMFAYMMDKSKSHEAKFVMSVAKSIVDSEQTIIEAEMGNRNRDKE